VVLDFDQLREIDDRVAEPGGLAFGLALEREGDGLVLELALLAVARHGCLEREAVLVLVAFGRDALLPRHVAVAVAHALGGLALVLLLAAATPRHEQQVVGVRHRQTAGLEHRDREAHRDLVRERPTSHQADDAATAREARLGLGLGGGSAR